MSGCADWNPAMPRKADPTPRSERRPFPPIGVKVSTDMECRTYGIRARASWTDPTSKRRVIRTEIVNDQAAAHAFFGGLRNSPVKGMDASMTLMEFVTSIGDRWARGLDPTSTADTYSFGLKLRVLPGIRHLPVSQITAGMIDRTIDEWEHADICIPTIVTSLLPPSKSTRSSAGRLAPHRSRRQRSSDRSAVCDVEIARESRSWPPFGPLVHRAAVSPTPSAHRRPRGLCPGGPEQDDVTARREVEKASCDAAGEPPPLKRLGTSSSLPS